VFQIGSSLREARERRGLDLATVEHETRIRARWLTALEEERFDLLPERIYALGFLRTYAVYVGLDPRPLVDELSSRLPPEDAHDAPPPLLAASRSRVRPAIAVAGTLLVTVALVALIANRTGGARHPPPGASPPRRDRDRSSRRSFSSRHAAAAGSTRDSDRLSEASSTWGRSRAGVRFD